MMRQCAQILCVGLVFGGAVYLAQVNRFPASTDAATEPAAYGELWTPTSEINEQLAEFLQSPAHAELREALGRLHAARKQLMRTAVAGDQESTSAAAQEYAAHVQRLQAALERVKDRVAPGELTVVLQDLTYQSQLQDVSAIGANPPYVWELGPFAREVTP